MNNFSFKFFIKFTREILTANVFSDEFAANILEHDHNSGSVHKRRLWSLRRVSLSWTGSFLAYSCYQGILGCPGSLDVRLRGRPRLLRHVFHLARAALHYRGNLTRPFQLKFICSIRGNFNDIYCVVTLIKTNLQGVSNSARFPSLLARRLKNRI